MKKIIQGIRYDTEKAILIGEYDNLHHGADSHTDFNYWEAGLYKTPRSGRYFLAGEGGAMTRFSRPCGSNGTPGGEGLFPLDAQEALAWAEAYLDSEVVKKHFGDIIEDA
jgi:hypothetical protein